MGRNEDERNGSTKTGARFALLLSLIVLLTLARVATTHRTFSQTLDEPAHMAAGYDWITGAPYTIDPTHPPLARALAAVPAWLEEVPRSDAPGFVDRGNAIFYADGRYHHNLAAARIGNLLLLAAGIVAVAFWARRLLGDAAGIIAAVLFAAPPVLGHAGVVTTDLAVAVTLPIAAMALVWWFERPAPARAIALGLALGIGMLSKFSFLLFFPVVAVIVIACVFRPRAARPKQWASAGIAAMVAFLTVWGGYRFEVGTIAAACSGCDVFVAETAPAPMRQAVESFAANVKVPAPMLLVGIAAVKDHGAHGHLAYFLGEVSDAGWWYYFPLLLFFKTPLALLILWGIGTVALMRRGLREDRTLLVPPLIVLGLLASVIPTSINIGVRHILPVYAPMAIAAAGAVVMLWRARAVAARAVAAILFGWFILDGVMAHPDYLAWFNQAAGRHPEEIAVDSNLDWGQDILRLSRDVKTSGIENPGVLLVTSTYLDQHIGPVRSITEQPAAGWYVVSESALRLDDAARAGKYDWLVNARRPYRRVGKSLRVYHIE